MLVDPFQAIFDLLDKYGPMRRVDIEARLTGLKWKDRVLAVQAAVDRGYLNKGLDPILRIRILLRSGLPYKTVNRENLAPSRTYVNGAMTEAAAPDKPLVGRPGQEDFKKHMEKYKN